jgi:hypothetical protein
MKPSSDTSQTSRRSSIIRRNLHWAFCLALTLFYLSLTPGTIEGAGYNQENLVAASQIGVNLTNLLLQRPFTTVNWPRHGILESVLELPFTLVSHLLFGPSVKWAGRVMVLQPILATSLLCSLVFLWVRRLTGSLRWSYILSLAAGVSTMLWPYAYIGLETTQSLSLLLSGYLAIAHEGQRGWRHLLAFACACGVAVSVKLNGVFLLPSVCFLIYCYFTRNPGQRPGALRARLPKLSVLLAVTTLIYALNNYTRAKHWAGVEAGATSPFFEWLADNPLLMLFHAFSYFGSVNKSLLIYAPAVALSLISLKRAYSKHARLVIFSLLTLFGLLGGFSLLYMWAEETWGPRYLHSAVAPLILCLASAVSDKPFRWRREILLLAVMVLGVAVSFLGSLFYYGKLHEAATQSLHSTLEEIQHDPALNHLRFNFELLKVWSRGRLGQPDRPEPWPPSRHWWFSRPLDAPPEKTIDLREYANPQPLLANGWKESSPIPRPIHQLLRLVCFICLVISIGLFAVITRLVTTRAVDGSLND